MVKSRAFFGKKEKDTIGILVPDVKEIKRVELPKFGPSIEIIALDGTKIVLSQFSNLDEALKRLEQHRRYSISDEITLKSRSLTSLGGRKNSDDQKSK